MDDGSSQQPPTILTRGWLNKSPPLSKFKGFGSCKKRYFMLLQVNPNSDVMLKKSPKKGSKQMARLQEFYLVYWETDAVKKRPKRAIPIFANYQVNKFYNYENVQRNIFSLITNDRIYLFTALTEETSNEEMNTWCKHLTKVINQMKRKDTPVMEADTDIKRLSVESIYDLNRWFREGESDGSTTGESSNSSSSTFTGRDSFSDVGDSVSTIGGTAGAIQATYGSCYLGSVESSFEKREISPENVGFRRRCEGTLTNRRSQSNEISTCNSRSSDGTLSARSMTEMSADAYEIIKRSTKSRSDAQSGISIISRPTTNEKVDVPAPPPAHRKSKIKYNLNSTEDSVNLVVFDPAIGLEITHGQYEITIKQKDSC